MALNTLRLQLRFLLPLVLVLTAAAFLALPLLDRLTLRWFARDLDLRGNLVATALSDAVADALNDNKGERLQALLERSTQDERLLALGLCSLDGRLLRHSRNYPADLDCPQAQAAAERPAPQLRLASGAVHLSVHTVMGATDPVAQLVMLHDLSFVERRSLDTQRYLVAFIVALGVAIALITVVVAQLSWRGWINGARALLRGEGLIRPPRASARELEPVAAELRARLRDLDDAYRRSLGPQTHWDPERLRDLLRTQLRGDQVIVVSNREPYIHERRPGGIEVMRPASGLITAVEPVMRACSGTWIAHGSGSADAEVVDSEDRVRVPPGSGEYTLRRIWLTPAEE